MSAFDSNDADDGLSMEERIAWLRRRGVQVEIPGEVGRGPENSGTDTVTVVRVPADDSLPYEDVEIGGFSALQVRGDELPQKLRMFFASSSSEINTELLKETASKQFGSQNVKLTSESLKKATALGSVETFSLDSPCDANGLVGVNIYLDEAGQLKGLRPNARASALARQCGYLNVPFVGDVYVGRIAIKRSKESGAVVSNTPFKLTDLDSSSSWMKNAETRNYQLGVTQGKVSMDGPTGEDCVSGNDEEKGIIWTESMEAVEVQFTFPGGASYTSKQFTVKFYAKGVVISLKPGVAADGAPSELANLSLAGAISTDESTWMVSGPVLTLYLEKSRQGLWQRLEAP